MKTRIFYSIFFSAAISISVMAQPKAYETLTFNKLDYHAPLVRTAELQNNIKLYLLPNEKSELIEIMVLFTVDYRTNTHDTRAVIQGLQSHAKAELVAVKEKGGLIQVSAMEGNVFFSCKMLKKYTNIALQAVQKLSETVQKLEITTALVPKRKSRKASVLADIEFEDRLFDKNLVETAPAKHATAMISGLIVGLSGNFDANLVTSALNRVHKIAPSNSEHKLPDKFTGKYAGTYNTVYSKGLLKTDYLRMGFLVPGMESDDHFPILVANELLNRSLLYQVRIRAGLAYSIQSVYGSSKYYGKVAISCRTSPGNVSTIIKAVKQVLTGLSGQNTGKKDIMVARKSVQYNFLWKISNDSNLLKNILRVDSLRLPYLYVTDYFNMVDSVSQSDIERVFREYLNPDKMTILVLSGSDKFSSR